MERNRFDAEITKVLELAALAYAVMVQILPEQELIIHSILVVNKSVSIATILRPIEYSKRKESVSRLARRRIGLRGGIPE